MGGHVKLLIYILTKLLSHPLFPGLSTWSDDLRVLCGVGEAIDRRVAYFAVFVLVFDSLRD